MNSETKIEPDWSRESKVFFSWAPSRSLVASLRAYQKYQKKNSFFAKQLMRLHKWRFRFWSFVTGADIDPRAQIEGGLMLPHPNGVVIHGNAIIGSNCMIMQQVTIGMTRDDKAPNISANVYIGAGAKILGPISIGENSSIGANAVVIRDVPPHSTAVGVPARNIINSLFNE